MWQKMLKIQSVKMEIKFTLSEEISNYHPGIIQSDELHFKKKSRKLLLNYKKFAFVYKNGAKLK